MCVATLTAAGAALGAVSSVTNGIAAGNAASYQAQVARNNATIQRQNAAYSASAAAAQAEQSGLHERDKLAAIRVGEAANGLDVNTGTPADLQTTQRELGTLDTQTVSNNAALTSYGYQTKATADEAQAGIDSAEAGFDPIAGGISGASKLLSNPTVDQAGSGFAKSLISLAPTVSPAHQWMVSSSGDADDGIY